MIQEAVITDLQSITAEVGAQVAAKPDQMWEPPFVVVTQPLYTPDYHTTGGSGMDEAIIFCTAYGDTYNQAKTIADAMRLKYSNGISHQDFHGVFVKSLVIRGGPSQTPNFIQDGTDTGNPGCRIELQIQHVVPLAA